MSQPIASHQDVGEGAVLLDEGRVRAVQRDVVAVFPVGGKATQQGVALGGGRLGLALQVVQHVDAIEILHHQAVRCGQVRMLSRQLTRHVQPGRAPQREQSPLGGLAAHGPWRRLAAAEPRQQRADFLTRPGGPTSVELLYDRPGRRLDAPDAVAQWARTPAFLPAGRSSARVLRH